MANELSEHLHRCLELPKHSFTYGDGMTGSKRIKSALARFLNRKFQPIVALEPSHFAITNGYSSAVEHLAWAIANPGDAFLLGRPYYNTFVPDLALKTGCKVIAVDFQGSDPLAAQAVHHYELALKSAIEQGQRVAGLIISNPHNPLGRCHSRASLFGLMKLCALYDMHFISDEVYALPVWENNIDRHPEPVPFESCLALSTADVIPSDRVHTIWGMSKDFGANGLRIGAIISQANPSLHVALVPVALYSSPSSVSDHIAANILEDGPWADSFIQQNQARLAERYQYVVRWAKNHNIPYVPGANAAFFLWADLGSVWKRYHLGAIDDQHLDDFLMKLFLEHRVYISSGKDFGSEYPGWFRIVFSQDEVLLKPGLERLAAALRPQQAAKL